MQLTLAAAVLLLAAVICAATAVVAWSRRHDAPAARWLITALVGTVVWSATSFAVQCGLPDDVLRPVLLLSLAGVYGMVSGFWCLARVVADPRVELTARTPAALAVVPLLLLAAQATDVHHQLFFAIFTVLPGAPWVLIGPGPVMHVATAYCLLLAVTSSGRLAIAWRRAPAAFRRQIGPVLLGTVPPIVGGTLNALAPGVTGEVDLAPVWLTATGLLTTWALTRHGLMRVNPVHRWQVVQAVTDAVTVIDPQGIVVDTNPAAVALMQRLRPGAADRELIGRDADVLVPPALLARLLGPGLDAPVEALPGLHLDIRATPLTDTQGRLRAVVLVARDVSQAHLQQRALALANEELRDQLGLIEVLRAQLAEDAVRDPLTGLHNRRHLTAALDDALARGRAAGTPTGLLLLDVDHFKRVNDRYGHAAGDTVLQSVAGALIAATRPGDVLARWGGEEFVLVLPGADDRALLRRAEELRLSCRSLSIEVGDLSGAAVSLTVSVGAAGHPVDAPDAAGLIEAADAALYRAKDRGRDRVVLASRRARQPI